MLELQINIMPFRTHNASLCVAYVIKLLGNKDR